ncbi:MULTISPECIES: holin [unclassified Streptomyces]|uniref:holin n=1 Tax=unclassified Streptomyces TaxID=2593676 RepID=UPI0038127F62
MPTRAPKRCTTGGCSGTPTPGSGKCPRCARPRPRPSAAAQGYGREHERRFRAGVLARDTVCVLCMQTPAVHADHWPLSKRELVERGLDDNDPRRGRGLCASCHSKETAEHQPGGWNRKGPQY